MPERTLGAVLYEDFELLDLYGPLEVFGCLGADLRIVTVAAQAGPVRSSYGPRSVADFDFDSCPELDLILVPGGIGTPAALNDQGLRSFLAGRAPRAEVTLSVCSGAALLAAVGLLDGKRATTNKLFFRFSSEPFPDVKWAPAARFVDEGSVATSSGVSAGIDLALALVERLYGRDRAEKIATLTEYVWNRDPEQDPFTGHLDQGQPQDLWSVSMRA